MAKTRTYSMEKILAVREVLRKLPVKEKEKSRAEVVDFLKADLRKAVKQGHGLKEIQAILAEQGISVALSSMEAVLGQSGKGSVREKSGASSSSPKVREMKPKEDAPKSDAIKPEIPNSIPPQKTEQRKMPSYFTPDLPDSEL